MTIQITVLPRLLRPIVDVQALGQPAWAPPLHVDDPVWSAGGPVQARAPNPRLQQYQYATEALTRARYARLISDVLDHDKRAWRDSTTSDVALKAKRERRLNDLLSRELAGVGRSPQLGPTECRVLMRLHRQCMAGPEADVGSAPLPSASVVAQRIDLAEPHLALRRSVLDLLTRNPLIEQLAHEPLTQAHMEGEAVRKHLKSSRTAVVQTVWGQGKEPHPVSVRDLDRLDARCRPAAVVRSATHAKVLCQFTEKTAADIHARYERDFYIEQGQRPRPPVQHRDPRDLHGRPGGIFPGY